MIKLANLTKADFMSSAKKIAIESGFSVDDLAILKTPGYFTGLAGETFETVLHYASLGRREGFESTAQLQDSLLKIGSGIQLTAGLAVPSEAQFIIFFNQNDLLKASNIDSEGRYVYTLNKDNAEVVLAGTYVFSLDYDIEIRVFDNPNRYFKSTEPYVYRAKYVVGDYVNQLDVKNANYNMPVNISRYDSDSADNALIGIIVNMKQYRRVYKTLRYISNNEAEIKVFEYENRLAGFNVRYKETDSAESRALKKTQYFNSASIADENIFFKISENKTIELINKRVGNFIPAINSVLTVEVYETLGSDGNVIYTGNDIVFTSSDSTVRSNVMLISNPVNGTNEPSLDELRNAVELAKYTRGSVINENDLKKYYDMSTGRYKVYKTRHDMYSREYNVYMALKNTEDNVFIETNTLPVRIATAYMLGYEDNYFKLSTNTIYTYNSELAYAYQESTDDVASFEYVVPFNMVYNKSKNYVEVYERYVNREYLVKNKYTNTNLDEHFIVNRVSMSKAVFGEHTMSFKLITSLGTKDNPILHTANANGGITDNGIIKVRALIKNSGITVGYIDCVMSEYDSTDDLYKYIIPEGFVEDLVYNNNCRLHCKDFETKEDQIVELPIAGNEVYVYIYYKSATPTYHDDFFTDIVGYELATTYYATEIDFFKNISHLNNLQCNYISKTGIDVVVDILNTPLVSKRMMESTPDYVYNLLNYELSRLENIYGKTEENYDLNINFANTHGFSKKYKIGVGGVKNLDSIGLAFEFIVKLPTSSTITEVDCIDVVKEYVATVNFNNGDLFHVSNIINKLHSAFPEIKGVEFKGINGLATSYQSIELQVTDTTTVPEYLNVEHIYSDYLETYIPNIKITLQSV